MYRGRRVAVVVPARDEERFVGDVIRTLPDFVDHVIVVDDCSGDGTAAAARSTGDPRLTLIQTPRNSGVGGAVCLGYREALRLGADVVAKMDGDGQMPPEFLGSLLDAVIDGDHHYAKGNRFLRPESLRAMPTVRLLGNICLTFLTKLASGYWHIFDPQNGYTAIRADCLEAIDLDAVHRGFFFENDMLVQLNLHGFRVKDVAIPARYGDEASALTPLSVSVRFPALLARRYFARVYRKHVVRDFSPVALFLFVGLALFGWGVLFGIYLWIRSNLTGHATPTGTIILALVPLILGFQLLLQAIVLEIEESRR